MKGFNSLAKLTLSQKRKGTIKNWVFYPGDTVEVIGGKDEGKRGKILNVVKPIDRLVVDGVRLAKKHVKPNASNRTGQIVTKPMPVHYSDVKLVDPVVSSTTDVELKRALNPKTGRWELQRLLAASKTFLPIPSAADKYENYPGGTNDTSEALAKLKTWTPSISSTPFPPLLMNQLEKFKRIKKEPFLL
ncbi:hypothetical protein HDU67_007635 [Dinochytrium kinnereticum]|nr:hypothetical protein HDU67_007635 [Dinochytrium kinnereticum]